MRKAYYVYYPRNFANEYDLRWAWDCDKEAKRQLESNGCERITKKRAMELVRQEKYRQEYDQSMSGYADDAVMPWYWERDMWYRQYNGMPYATSWPYYYCKNNIVGKIDEI